VSVRDQFALSWESVETLITYEDYQKRFSCGETVFCHSGVPCRVRQSARCREYDFYDPHVDVNRCSCRWAMIPKLSIVEDQTSTPLQLWRMQMDEPGPSSIPVKPDVTPGDDVRHLIQPGNQLLIRLPTKEVRNIRIDPSPGDKSVNLGKFGSFKQKYLVGQPYGLSYELQSDKTLVTLPPRRLEELGEPFFLAPFAKK
jgi:Gcd10p family